MQAACAMPSVRGWFAISPVVQPDYLMELQGVDTSRMGLDHCTPRLRARRGSLSYGDADPRVGVQPQRRLADMLAGPLVSMIAYAGLDHTITTQAIDFALRSTKYAVVDPLAVARNANGRRR